MVEEIHVRRIKKDAYYGRTRCSRLLPTCGIRSGGRSSPQLNTDRAILLASNNKEWRGGRSTRGGRQQQPTLRTHVTDGGRPMEAWANSASVWRERTTAEPFSRRDLLAGEEDSIRPSGPISSDRPRGGLSGQSTSSNGPGYFPNLIADQWTKLLTALNNSSNTQSEKLSDASASSEGPLQPSRGPNPYGPPTQQPGRLPPTTFASSDGPLHPSRGPAPCGPALAPPVQHKPRQQASSHGPAAKLAKVSGSFFDNPDCYRRLIGKLIYLTLTRPELAYAVYILAQFMHAPRRAHWNAAIRVVRYLKGSPGRGILLQSDSPILLITYCDSDWATCPITRCYITGYFISLGGSPISWKTKKQHIVSRSSAETEYRSMALTLCEIKWLSILLRDLLFLSLAQFHYIVIIKLLFTSPKILFSMKALNILKLIVILYAMLSKMVLFSLSTYAVVCSVSFCQVSGTLSAGGGCIVYPGISNSMVKAF
ncbi:hypothetical protein M9H77_22112 [Catharanthus roseus]|uniref:Uncharacterized protein n=1 Tax=Catharanthus roseus TaxID=4058 RepID=A0ACC0ARK6_CATRO|nr:hypothetical protein M9H77_22112 [Catharanthus roseus]